MKKINFGFLIINSILTNIRSRTENKLERLICYGLKIFSMKNIENYFFVFKIYQIANIRYKNNSKSTLLDFKDSKNLIE